MNHMFCFKRNNKITIDDTRQNINEWMNEGYSLMKIVSEKNKQEIVKEKK